MKPYLSDRHLVAVSGGADSVALFHLNLHLKKHFQLRFDVAHIHHGPGSLEQVGFRDKARDFVKELCRNWEVPFHGELNPPESKLSSEAELRSFRLGQLKGLAHELGCSWIQLAQHKEDQLETRLIRLIRGTGPKD